MVHQGGDRGLERGAPDHAGGEPRYSALAITTALTLRGMCRLAFRQTEGMIGSIIALLGLDLAVPDHTTLSRRIETLKVPQPHFGTRPLTCR